MNKSFPLDPQLTEHNTSSFEIITEHRFFQIQKQDFLICFVVNSDFEQEQKKEQKQKQIEINIILSDLFSSLHYQCRLDGVLTKRMIDHLIYLQNNKLNLFEYVEDNKQWILTYGFRELVLSKFTPPQLFLLQIKNYYLSDKYNSLKQQNRNLRNRLGIKLNTKIEENQKQKSKAKKVNLERTEFEQDYLTEKSVLIKEIERLKRAKEEHQYKKKKLKKKILSGFIQHHEKWTKSKKGTKIAITNSSRTVKEELTLTLNSEKGSTSVRGVTIFSDITIYFVQAKIDAIDFGFFSRNRIYLGICKHDAEKESAGKIAWVFDITGKRIREPNSNRWITYGKIPKVGDIIGIVIDLINKTISYQINGEDMGIAFKNIPKKISIYARVHLGQLTLL
ncbi:spry domain-containing socs box protein [Anaeramoeba flamelloides]|uniref:Spry domain-containing socs box protein n=1 Tax=Anaeramoeba flamelloides TaxID=1746091 RepID=A0ABQ8YG03_9EUKA|nr:spry domain-containing socs box protein [Anaeramoeba flamelloides]